MLTVEGAREKEHMAGSGGEFLCIEGLDADCGVGEQRSDILYMS